MASHHASEQLVWDTFMAIYGGNEYAAAGACGNMQAESGLYSDNAENSWNSMTGHSDEWLTERINDGRIDLTEFLKREWWVNSYGFGYGLSQWTDTTRRTKLWEWTVSAGYDIDDVQRQLDYITWEWTDSSSYYNRFLNDMKAMTDVESATRYYCRHYEVGAWNSSRLTYAEYFYRTYATGSLHIDVSVSGNGTASVDDYFPQIGQTITLTCIPASGETLIDIDARTISGYSVAIDPTLLQQTFTMPNESIIIAVTFSGTTPPTPVTSANKRKRMPIWMYPYRRV